MPLVDVDRAGALQLLVTVDESLLRAIATGSKIEVSIPAVSSDPIDAGLNLLQSAFTNWRPAMPVLRAVGFKNEK